MSIDQIQLLTALVISGVGLFLLGIVKIAFRSKRAGIVLGVHAMIVALASAGVIASNLTPELIWSVSGLLTTATIFTCVTSSSSFHQFLLILVSSIRRPAFQAGMMALGGVALIGYGMYRFDRDLDQTLDNDNSFLEQAVWKPNLRPAVGTVAFTDKGLPVSLQTTDEIRTSAEMAEMEDAVLDQITNDRSLIRICGPDDRTNCHGWVFTGGRSWLPTDNVESILADNGYRPVSSPSVGDLAIFREPNSKAITHTAIVRIVTGETPIVESKWGWMGVFLHAVDQSCYGTCFTYYHSERNGHILVGLGIAKSPEIPSFPTSIESKIGGD